MKTITFFLLLLSSNMIFAQQERITVLDSGHNTSLRGLSIVNNNIIWASGSNGTVAKSLDGGKTFEWLTVAGYEKRDFRDIEAFDANTALILAVAEPAIILKTKDGGKNWYKVFEDTTKGMFLDAMDFQNKNFGIVIGDPIKERFFLAITFDNGENWNKGTKLLVAPIDYSGEACFAASGTNILLKKNGDYLIISGGKQTEIMNGLGGEILQMIQGKETTGANSISTWKEKYFAVVGGDFSNDKDTTGNCALSFNHGDSWVKPQTSPHGYRSCVAYITSNKLISCGTSGIDISEDGGKNWQLISNQSFHVCQKAKKGNAVFLAGANGKIARLLD